MPRHVAGGAIDLRALVEDEVGELAMAIRASTAELRPWADWLHGIPTMESHRDFVRRAVAAFEAGTGFTYSIHEGDAEGIVGICRLELDSAVSGEIAVWVRTDRVGRGYAQAALSALTQAAFGHLPTLDELFMFIDAANAPAAGLASRLGFRLEAARPAAIRAPGEMGVVQRWSIDRAAVPDPSC